MARTPKTVFISYRRTNQAHAIKIYQLLQESGYDPFLDIKDLGAGAWRVIIQREIQRRAHFVLLLTPSAVERFAEPNDVMRFEIETALDNKRNLVPLMFDGFSYSDPRIHDYLTGKLSILSEYNAFPINWRRLKKDIQELIDRFMSIHPDDVVHPEETMRGGLVVDRREQKEATNDDAYGEMVSPEPTFGEMPDWLSADEDEAVMLEGELLDLAEEEEVIDDSISTEKAKKDAEVYPRQPSEAPKPIAPPLAMPQPSAKKSGGASVLMAIITAPVALVYGAYQAIRNLINPPQPSRAIPDKTVAPEPAPRPAYQPAPAPVPPPQSIPGGISSEFGMDEAQLLLMMREAMANLPPVSDEQLALEEAEERGV